MQVNEDFRYCTLENLFVRNAILFCNSLCNCREISEGTKNMLFSLVLPCHEKGNKICHFHYLPWDIKLTPQPALTMAYLLLVTDDLTQLQVCSACAHLHTALKEMPVQHENTAIVIFNPIVFCLMRLEITPA